MATSGFRELPPECNASGQARLVQFWLNLLYTFYLTSLLYNFNSISYYWSFYITVYTKTPRFPYIILPAQEVRVYFVAMITLRHALVCECSTCALYIWSLRSYPIQYLLCCMFLYEAPLISVYGAGPPKVIGPREVIQVRNTLLHKLMLY